MKSVSQDGLRARVIEEADAVERPDPELADKLWEQLASRLGEPYAPEPPLSPRAGLAPPAARETALWFARKGWGRAFACSVIVGGGAALWAYQGVRAPAASSNVLQPMAAEPASVQPASLEMARSQSTPPAPGDDGALGDLSEEARLLGEAQRALSRGAPSESLRWLEQHTARFPAGVLAPERDAARVFALCALGRRGEARKERQRFAHSWPSSPLGAVVRATCASSRPGAPPKLGADGD